MCQVHTKLDVFQFVRGVGVIGGAVEDVQPTIVIGSMSSDNKVRLPVAISIVNEVGFTTPYWNMIWSSFEIAIYERKGFCVLAAILPVSVIGVISAVSGST